MKRISLWISVAALLFAGCQQETIEPAAVEDGTVRITVSLDDAAQTKADDLSSISKLYFEVYDENDVRILPEVSNTVFPSADDVNTVTVTDGKAVIDNIQLMKNRSYTFVFWAMSDGAPYTWKDLGAIAMNYGEGNVERDAFAGSAVVNTTSEVDMKVTLKRPFAQLNFGTSLSELVVEGDHVYVQTSIATSEKKYRYLGSSVTVKGVADTFNAITMTGTAAGVDEITFMSATILDEVLSAGNPSVDYAYMSKEYLLLPGKAGESGLADVSAIFKMSEEPGETPSGEITSTYDLPNVPLQANYRTNLVGTVFTFGTNLSVTLDQWAGTDDNDLWDGASSEVEEVDGVYTVNTASELAWIAEQVNTGANDFAGKTVRLADDINLLGYEWIPIGTDEYPFKGTFDGEIPVRSASSDFFTISNLTVNTIDSNAGLFGYTDGADLKNIKFVNANITNVDNVTSYAGVLVGKASDSKISNVDVTQSRIFGACNLGGLAGYSDVLPENCSVAEVDVKIDQSGLETPVQHNSALLVGSGCDAGAYDTEGSTFIEQFVDAGAIHDLMTDEYAIYTKEGLFWMAEEVNKVEQYAKNRFDGKLVKLMNDIDMKEDEWIPIGDFKFSATQFTGTFDGQNHTVSNVRISKNTAKADSKKSSYGFFGNVNGNIRNLTLDGVDINAYAYTGALVGRFNGGILENCHVKNSAVKNNYWQGGILIGQQNGICEVRNCTVDKSSITAASAAGVITGLVSGDTESAGVAPVSGKIVYEQCAVSDCEVIQEGSFGASYDLLFGSLFADFDTGEDDVYITGCTVKDTKVKGETNAPIFYSVSSGNVFIDGTKIDDQSILISSAEQLVAASTATIAKGQSVILMTDIDLTGIEFTGLNAFNPENNNIFDGLGHTVSNWTNESGASDFGFIKQWVGPIRNLTIRNASLKTSGRSAVLAAKVYGDITNCHVYDSSIEDSYWACGIIAGLYNSGNIDNCSVNGCKIASNGGTGGIVGVINETSGTRKVTNCTVMNTTVNNSGIYGESYCGALVCGMLNVTDSVIDFTGCKMENNVKEGKYLGDLYYNDEENTIIQ